MSLTMENIFREPKRGAPTRPVAFCLSERCSPSTYGIKSKPKANAEGAWCPDCGHALLWERVVVAPDVAPKAPKYTHKVPRPHRNREKKKTTL
jgi:hypothetical protein